MTPRRHLLVHLVSFALSVCLTLVGWLPWDGRGMSLESAVLLGAVLLVLAAPLRVACGMVRRERLDVLVVRPSLLLSGVLLLVVVLFSWPHDSAGAFDIGGAATVAVLICLLGLPVLGGWVGFEVLAARRERGKRPLVR